MTSQTYLPHISKTTKAPEDVDLRNLVFCLVTRELYLNGPIIPEYPLQHDFNVFK